MATRCVTAIVPARSGSRGIPGKNFRPLCGRSPVNRACDVALQVAQRVIVTTDAPEELIDLPSGVDWLARPARLAEDATPMYDVVAHALEQVQGPLDEVVVLLQPSQPLRTVGRVRQALTMLECSDADSVVSVVPVPQEYSPSRLCDITHAGWLYLADGALLDAGPRFRQAARQVYRRDGTVYVMRRRMVLVGSLYGDRCRALVIPPEESCVLDELADWAEAERRLGVQASIQRWSCGEGFK
jgi:CMP-N,N'-diacetyllegionaminic acid synthase